MYKYSLPSFYCLITLKAPQELKDKYPGTWTYTDLDGSTKTTDRSTFYGQCNMEVGHLSFIGDFNASICYSPTVYSNITQNQNYLTI